METKPYSIQAPEGIAKEYGGNKQQIAHAIQMGLVDPTAGLLAGMFIDRMRSAQTLEQAPQQTVAQQVFAPPVPAAPAGLGALPPGGPAQPAGSAAVPTQQPPPQAGLGAAPGPEKMFNSQSMAAGGIVAFAEGGESSSERKKLLMRVANDPQASREDRRAAMVELNHMEGLGDAKLSSLPDLSGMANATYEGPRGMDLVKSMMPSRAEPTYDPYTARANLSMEPEADPYSASASVGIGTPKGKYAAPGWYGVAGEPINPWQDNPNPDPNYAPKDNSGAHSRLSNILTGSSNAAADADRLRGDYMSQLYGGIGSGIKHGLGSIYDFIATPEGEIKDRNSNKPSYKSDGNIPVSLGDYKPGYGDVPDYMSGFKIPTTSFDEDTGGGTPYPKSRPNGHAGVSAGVSSRGPGYMGKNPETMGIPALMKQYQDLVGEPPEPEYLKGEKANLDKEKNQDLWTALAQIGFGMAGTKSPYFMQAVGEAGSAAMPGISKAIDRQRADAKDIDKAQYAAQLAKYGVKGDAAKTAVQQYEKQQENATRLEGDRIQAGATIQAAQIRASVDRDMAQKNPYVIAMEQQEILHDPRASAQAKATAQGKIDYLDTLMNGAKYSGQEAQRTLAHVAAVKVTDAALMMDREYKKLKGPAKVAYRNRMIRDNMGTTSMGGAADPLDLLGGE